MDPALLLLDPAVPLDSTRPTEPEPAVDDDRPAGPRPLRWRLHRNEPGCVVGAQRQVLERLVDFLGAIDDEKRRRGVCLLFEDSRLESMGYLCISLMVCKFTCHPGFLLYLQWSVRAPEG